MGNQSSVLVRACTMTHDFSIKQIHQHTNVMPSIDLIEMLGDMESEDSLYVLLSENIFKNYISVFEDYLKDILEFLFNKYPNSD
ncbi:hypothetical protein C1I60_19470 [Paenibacillus terrae]|uniref:Uncharacterized protein n=1 Tax=Paenibacillus terrae TaxID=159743 RepID=A0A4U2PWA8_9BACL|nr:hypothetical protein C1I60_19470 [Paenibacillus terrae]